LAEQIDGYVRELFADVFAARAPGLERFGDLSLEQAELQRDIGRVEPLRDLVRPSPCLC
jgi:hypothetical protein